MNIIIVNDFSYVNGGASRVAIDEAVGLAKKGVNVYFFCALGPPDADMEKSNAMIVCTKQEEISINRRRIQAAVQGLWNIKAAKLMSDLLKGFDRQDTIVHVHGWTKSLSAAPIHVAIKNNFPVVITLHDYFTACPNGGFYNYQRQEVCHLKPLSKACIFTNCDKSSYAQKIWRVMRQFIQIGPSNSLKRVEFFIAVSDFSNTILLPFLPEDARIFRLDYPINIDCSEPAIVNQNALVAAAGRVSPEKGLALFLQAVTDLGINALCIGDGPQLNVLKSIYSSVNFPGWLSRDQLCNKIKMLRCLVFPSLWYETHGIIVQEAAAMGVTSIVSDETAARSIVEDGITGLWFKHGDTIDLKKKIEMLYTDPVLAARLGKAAYDRFWANPPTLNRHIQDLQSIYAEILAR